MSETTDVQVAATDSVVLATVEPWSAGTDTAASGHIAWTLKLAECGIETVRRSAMMRRMLDIVVSLIALTLMLPFLPFLMLAIRLDSAGPIIFRQDRVGKNGKIFRVYKFRSMIHLRKPDDSIHRIASARWMAGERLETEEDANKASEAKRSGAPTLQSLAASGVRYRATPYKLASDPRITRMGRFLRATSIDELPQFLNVLRGDMSVVGPRPAVIYEVDRYPNKAFGRLLVKPGLTGLWQVEGRGRVTFAQMIELDLKYVAHNSFWGDVRLILLTVPAVVLGRGAA